MEISNETFMKCTKHKEASGRFDIDCALGLWGVSAPSKEMAETEAKFYFIQYYNDGEYSEMLDNQE